MRLRVFTAADMASAMAMVRQALGDNAIIISSETDKARKHVTVKAAVEEERIAMPSAPAPRRAVSASSGEWLEEITSLLRYHGVPEALAGTLIYKGRGMDFGSLPALQRLSANSARAAMEEHALSRLLAACFTFAPLNLARGDSRVMLVGPPGIGKTLAVAKFAATCAMEHAPFTVITTDTKRAGGIEQLSAFTDILGVKLQVAANNGELAALLRAAPPAHRVFIDTAGCNPYERVELEELAGLIGVSGFEPVLVLPAGMDAHEAADMGRAFAFPAIRRLLATRADATRRFGSLLAAAGAADLAFSHISGSSRVVGELTPLDAAVLAQCLLRYRLQNA